MGDANGGAADGDGRRAQLRRATLQLVLAVAAVHGVAIALYDALDIATGPDRTRTIFVAVWTCATALTVAFLLRRVRAARRLTLPRR
ncbi:MAG: hypothetical protein JWL60_2370 [Gemmatimonadetes bacterium]|nr:hypothetical protein [Gemmatimonadota bacterium]